MALNPNLQEALAKKTGPGWQELQKQLLKLLYDAIKQERPYIAIVMQVPLRETMTKNLRNWLHTNAFDERVVMQTYGQYPMVVIQLMEELSPNHIVQPTHTIEEGWKLSES